MCSSYCLASGLQQILAVEPAEQKTDSQRAAGEHRAEPDVSSGGGGDQTRANRDHMDINRSQ